MRVLLDNNVNVRFGRSLPSHEVTHVLDLGWERLENGDLLAAAERSCFDAMVTADKNLRHQQNFGSRKISVIVLNSLFIKWDSILPMALLTGFRLSIHVAACGEVRVERA